MATTMHRAVEYDTKPALINYVAAIFAQVDRILHLTVPMLTILPELQAHSCLAMTPVSLVLSSRRATSISMNTTSPLHEYYKPSTGAIGALVAVLAGGAFFGALMAGQTADRIGRKHTIQLGATIAIVGCVIQTASINMTMLICGRAIAGLAIGFMSMIVPMYQAEISPPHARGLLSGWTQLMISWGSFSANLVGYGCGYIENNNQFRIPLGIQIVPAGILLIGMFFLPYSPRWLAKKGRTEEAREVLIRLHGGRESARIEVVEAEVKEMLTQIEWEREHLSTSYKDLTSNRPNLHRTLAGCGIQSMCQWTGVNVNNYFGPTIYAALGYSGHKTLQINFIHSVLGLIVTWTFITFIVDRVGRRKPLIFGSLMCAVAMAWQTGTNAPFTEIKDYHSKSMGIAGVAAVFFFSVAFSTSFGPVSWIYQSEIFPTNIRALGGSVSTASNWLNNVIIAQVTPYGFKHLGYKYFLVFVCTCISNTIICYFLFPETKNKTLEEIGLAFGDTNVRVSPEQRDMMLDNEETIAHGGEKIIVTRHEETV